MIAAAVCPECKESIWLLGAAIYIPVPAIEVFGEGIYFELDDDRINK
jgi:hypothetical protein